MTKWHQFWRGIARYLLLRTPLLSYGELVLRPVTIAERRAGGDPAFAAGQNKT
jgi:hypothetical protein